MMVFNGQAEYAAVSAMLHDADCAVAAVAELTAEDFTQKDTLSVFKALQERVKNGTPTDTVSMCVAYPDLIIEINNCMEAFSLSSQLQEYIDALHDATQRRRVIDGCKTAIRAAEDWSDREYLRCINMIGPQNVFTSEKVSEVGLAALEAVTGLYEAKCGTRIGFGDLDNLLLGFHPGELIVLGARPGVGKSTFAMNAAVHVARFTGPVAIFSLEMGTEQLLQRAAMAESSVCRKDILGGDMKACERLVKAGETLSRMPLYISDKSYMTVDKIRAYCLRVKQQQGRLSLIVIDYLQLLSSSRRRDSREQEVAEQTRALKILARDLECPILLLSQLNRSINGEPKLSNLRESGAIEQDADVVIFLHEDEDNPKQAFAIVAKHRNGPVGTITLAFESQYSRFRSLDWVSDADAAVQMEWR